MDASGAAPIRRDDRGRSGSRPGSDLGGQLTPFEELSLVEAHRGGSPEALSELLKSYQHRIYTVCYRMVRSDHEARDLAQDAIVKVIEGLDSYDGRAKLSTWIIRVTMNSCLSNLRKQKVRRAGSLEAMTGDDGPPPISSMTSRSEELSAAGRVEQAEMKAVVARCLQSLDAPMRAVLVLRDVQDLGYQQIGEVMGVPVGTVKSRLFRARAALRSAIQVEMDRAGLIEDDEDQNRAGPSG